MFRKYSERSEKMFKITYGDNVEEIENEEDLIAKIITICSKKNSNLRVYKKEKKDWKPIFKTSKFLEEDEVWISRIKIENNICQECFGNGSTVINEFQQSTICEECNGKGNISKKTEFMEVKGPYKIWEMKEDWAIFKIDNKEINVHQTKMFIQKEDAEQLVNDWNKIKIAEKQALEEKIRQEKENI